MITEHYLILVILLSVLYTKTAFIRTMFGWRGAELIGFRFSCIFPHLISQLTLNLDNGPTDCNRR